MAGPKIALTTSLFPIRDASDKYVDRKGGVERYVDELSRALVDQGFRVKIVAPSDQSGVQNLGNLEIVNFPRRGHMFDTPVFDPLQIARIVKDCDLIHAQGIYPILTDLNPFIGRLKSVPTVMTCHFEAVPSTPLGKAAGRMYELSLGRFVRLHDRVILSTNSYLEDSRFLKGLSADKFRVVPMGVRTEFFVPDASVRTAKQFLFVGRLVHFKAIPLLIRSMAIVNRTLPDHELLIVGTGELEAVLREEIRRSGANAKIMGKVSDEELLRLYQSSIATILPSHEHQESFGMTLIESMSCGTPVIGANIPGVRDVASIEGMLAEPGSEASLADMMLRSASRTLTRDEKLRLHSRIENSYSWKKVAEKTAVVYRELL